MLMADSRPECVCVQPCVGPGAGTTFDSQAAFVFSIPLEDGRELWVYAGDRWNEQGPGSVSACPACRWRAWLATPDHAPARCQGIAASVQAKQRHVLHLCTKPAEHRHLQLA